MFVSANETRSQIARSFNKSPFCFAVLVSLIIERILFISSFRFDTVIHARYTSSPLGVPPDEREQKQTRTRECTEPRKKLRSSDTVCIRVDVSALLNVEFSLASLSLCVLPRKFLRFRLLFSPASLSP